MLKIIQTSFVLRNCKFPIDMYKVRKSEYESLFLPAGVNGSRRPCESCRCKDGLLSRTLLLLLLVLVLLLLSTGKHADTGVGAAVELDLDES
jgi:hypothetical protein